MRSIQQTLWSLRKHSLPTIRWIWRVTLVDINEKIPSRVIYRGRALMRITQWSDHCLPDHRSDRERLSGRTNLTSKTYGRTFFFIIRLILCEGMSSDQEPLSSGGLRRVCLLPIGICFALFAFSEILSALYFAGCWEQLMTSILWKVSRSCSSFLWIESCKTSGVAHLCVFLVARR